MNELNYGSREACQRLVDAGIVVKTDFYWVEHFSGEWILIPENCFDRGDVLTAIPALSMAEAWRELPEERVYHIEGELLYEHSILTIEKHYGYSQAGYPANHFGFKMFDNINPTDALIDLLIWVTKQRKEKV
jgi:hypothetical protein